MIAILAKAAQVCKALGLSNDDLNQGYKLFQQQENERKKQARIAKQKQKAKLWSDGDSSSSGGIGDLPVNFIPYDDSTNSVCKALGIISNDDLNEGEKLFQQQEKERKKQGRIAKEKAKLWYLDDDSSNSPGIGDISVDIIDL